MKFKIEEVEIMHKALLTTIHFKLMNYNLTLEEEKEIRELYNVENKISMYLTAHRKGVNNVKSN